MKPLTINDLKRECEKQIKLGNGNKVIMLTDDDYIIFLDQDRTNFNINNLIKISRRESSIVANQKLFSKEPIVTETGIDIAKLMIKMKERKAK